MGRRTGSAGHPDIGQLASTGDLQSVSGWKQQLNMGNEGSSFKPHSGLAPSELEKLRQSFCGSAGRQLWPPWTDVFQQEQQALLVRALSDQKGIVSFEKYQQLAGEVGKGSVESRAQFLILMSGTNTEENLTTDSVKKGILVILQAFCRTLPHKSALGITGLNHCLLFAESLLHDFVFKNQKRKNTFSKTQGIADMSKEDVENLLLQHPIIENVLIEVLNCCFQVKFKQQILLPSLSEDQTSLSPIQILYLNHHLPHELRSIWRPLFNTDTHGESFSKLLGSITGQGPSLLIVWDETGNIFGGFATDSWKPGPKFYGAAESFLFHLHPKMNVYDSTPFNQNYQYLNIKQKTMPNGLGMGGQLDYFGFWLDSEFGLVRTSPTCSTFHSAQLSAQSEGRIRRLEVVGLGERKLLGPDETERSVLDLDTEAQAIMEMMGKTFHSKVIREVDEEADKKRDQK